MIELTSFRLLRGADVTGFEAADAKLQTQFAYQQPGLVRRTTAKGTDGGWVVITLWRSPQDADAPTADEGQEAVVEEFMSYVDPATVRSDRYSTLD